MRHRLIRLPRNAVQILYILYKHMPGRGHEVNGSEHVLMNSLGVVTTPWAVSSGLT